MELTLERYKCTKDYTLSRLYNSESKKLFVLDVVEPPLSGLSVKGHIKALDPGRYKLFLKAYSEESVIVPVFQSVAQRERFSFERLVEDTPLENLSFKSENHISTALMYCGKMEGMRLVTDKSSYTKFMFVNIVAKQDKQIIWVNVK